MATTIPEKFMDLFSDGTHAYANLATVMADGSPQVTPVWFDLADGRIRVNSARGRVKDKNMERDGRVALAISDPANPYRHLAIRGKVVNITEEGARAHIDKLAKKYMGADTYPGPPTETRVIYEIELVSVSAMG